MKILILGTGEAFDEKIPNTSILIESSANLLLDCGYSAVQNYFKYNKDPNFLDGIFISHPHADHYFGLAPLLIRMKEDGRNRPMKLFCGVGNKRVIEDMLDLGYRGAVENLSYGLSIFEVSKEKSGQIGDMKLSFAYSSHYVDNLGIRIEEKGKVLCYSGDGKLTPDTEKLYKKADLLIHESFTFDQEKEGHGTFQHLIKLVKKQKIKKLACVHVSRDEKKKIAKTKLPKNIFFPKPMQKLRL